MKKLGAVFLLSLSAFAAGSVTQQSYGLPQGNPTVWVTVFRWTGDATTGTVPNTSAQLNACPNACSGWFVVQAETVPGTPSPTAGYSVALNDAAGVDALAGAAASLSATVAQSFAASTAAPPVQGTITLAITGQSVASAQGIVYVFLQKPGTVNVATLGRGAIASSANWLTIANPPFVDARRYNFTAQSPGGSLSSGACSFILNPVPTGVQTGSTLYISGGTGTAEVFTITTLTGKTVSGTCANSHSGNWNVTSATAGYQESVNQCTTPGSGINVFSTGLSVIHTGIVFYPTGGTANCGINFFGTGTATIIQRASDFTSGDMIVAGRSTRANPGAQYSVHDLLLQTPDSVHVTSGGCIHWYDNTAQLSMRNIQCWSGYEGAIVDNVSVDIDGFLFWQTPGYYTNGFQSVNGLRFTNAAGQAAGPTGTVTHVTVQGSFGQATSTTNLNCGINIQASDGLTIADSFIAFANRLVCVGPSATSDIADTYLENLILDTPLFSGVYINGTSTGTTANFRIANSHIVAYANQDAGNTAVGVTISGAWNDVQIVGDNIAGFKSRGIEIDAGTAGQGNISITGNVMTGNAVGVAILTTNTQAPSDITISGNQITNRVAPYTDASSCSQGVGIQNSTGTLANVTITSNDFSACTTPISWGSTLTYTGLTVGNNIGVDDAGKATATAGAATMNRNNGTITSESLVTAAGSTYTLTLTDSAIQATSLLYANAFLGSSTQGTPQVVGVTPGAGTATVVVKNIHATQAFNGTIKIQIQGQTTF